MIISRRRETFMARLKIHYLDGDGTWYPYGSVVEVDSVESNMRGAGVPKDFPQPRWYVIADTDMMLRDGDYEVV